VLVRKASPPESHGLEGRPDAPEGSRPADRDPGGPFLTLPSQVRGALLVCGRASKCFLIHLVAVRVGNPAPDEMAQNSGGHE